MQFNKHSKQS